MIAYVPGSVRVWASRHPYGAIFLGALLLRVVVALVVALLLPQLSFFDDGTYSQLAQERLNGRSEQWDSYASWLYVHTGTLLFPLTLLYKVFGPHDLVGPLLVAPFGAGAAAIVARLVTLAVDLRRGVLAGCFLALLPSQVLISSVLAKDAMTWFLLASLALALAAAAGAASTRRVAWLVLLSSGLLTLLGLLRLHTMTVAAVAMLLACAFGLRKTRLLRTAGFGAVAVLVPLGMGVGPLGLQLIANHGSLEGTRAYHASGGSAVDGLAPKPATTASAVPGATPAPSPSAAVKPQAAAPEAEPLSSAQRNLAYLPRGVSVVLLEPVPWASDGSTAFRLAAAEAIVWYPVLALGLAGAAMSWRRRDVLAFPVLSGGALVCMWALVDGNIGTALRHRGEVVWAVAVLAAYALSRFSNRGRAAPYPPADDAPVQSRLEQPART